MLYVSLTLSVFQMPKKKNGQQTKAGAAATEKPEAEEVKAADTTAASQNDSITTEESKIVTEAPAKKAGLGERTGSRFDLNKKDGEVEEKESATLYRPEFGEPKNGQEKMWELMSSYIGNDQRSIQRSIVNHVEYTLARTRFNFDDQGAYQATAFSVRDRLIEAWNDTNQYHTVSNQSQIISSRVFSVPIFLTISPLSFGAPQ